MTVQELVEILKSFPQNVKVQYFDDVYGHIDVRAVEISYAGPIYPETVVVILG